MKQLTRVLLVLSIAPVGCSPVNGPPIDPLSVQFSHVNLTSAIGDSPIGMLLRGDPPLDAGKYDEILDSLRVTVGPEELGLTYAEDDDDVVWTSSNPTSRGYLFELSEEPSGWFEIGAVITRSSGRVDHYRARLSRSSSPVVQSITACDRGSEVEVSVRFSEGVVYKPGELVVSVDGSICRPPAQTDSRGITQTFACPANGVGEIMLESTGELRSGADGTPLRLTPDSPDGPESLTVSVSAFARRWCRPLAIECAVDRRPWPDWLVDPECSVGR